MYPRLPISNLHDEISSDESEDEIHTTEQYTWRADNSDGGRFFGFWKKVKSWRGRGSGRRENESRKGKAESGILDTLGAHFNKVFGVLIVVVAILAFVFYNRFGPTESLPLKMSRYNEDFAELKVKLISSYNEAFAKIKKELMSRNIEKLAGMKGKLMSRYNEELAKMKRKVMSRNVERFAGMKEKLMSRSNEELAEIKREVMSRYYEEFSERKRKFSLQRELSWKIINVTLFSHVFGSEERLRPAVLNLVGNNDKVKQLLSSISTVLTRSKISGQCESLRDLHHTQTTDKMKKYIEKFINSTIDNGSKCVHIPDLDIIPSSLGPYLHGLTDEISAKFKDIVYIFSLSTTYTPKRHTENVEKDLINVLKVVWLEEMGPERFGALMVRLAINAVLVE